MLLHVGLRRILERYLERKVCEMKLSGGHWNEKVHLVLQAFIPFFGDVAYASETNRILACSYASFGVLVTVMGGKGLRCMLDNSSRIIRHCRVQR